MPDNLVWEDWPGEEPLRHSEVKDLCAVLAMPGFISILQLLKHEKQAAVDDLVNMSSDEKTIRYSQGIIYAIDKTLSVIVQAPEILKALDAMVAEKK
jgi:hypothetical protein